jgi:fumigallin biosynthesis monooxygenase-like protein
MGARRRVMGARVHQGRWTVDNRKEIVILLIGMRVHRLRAPRRWLPEFRAMRAMLRQLVTDPRCGLLGYRILPGWRTLTVVLYWRSHAHLQKYAHDEMHRAAWLHYYQRAHASTAVGIWHETYIVPAVSYEAMYVNMPRLGLGRARKLTPVGRGSERAMERLGRPDAEYSELPSG